MHQINTTNIATWTNLERHPTRRGSLGFAPV
jgi:hypothetical protein